MDYMKHMPSALHDQYLHSMRSVWPEGGKVTNRLYTSETCIPLKECGRGQYTIVRKCICLSNLEVVAVKEIIGRHPEFRNDMQNSLDRLHKMLQNVSDDFIETKESVDDADEIRQPIFTIHDEYQLWLLPSRYICNLYGAFVSPGTGGVSLVFEHMKNGCLQDQIDFGAIPDERNIGTVAFVVLHALSEMHSQNCVHRDIKPSNILIGNDGIVKVADSFIIRNFDDVSSSKTFSGTLVYMSPERVKGEPYSMSTDVWSFGILMIRYCTNGFPYNVTCPWSLAEAILNGPIMTVMDNSSPSLRDFITICIRTEPELRPTVKDLLDHPFIQKYASDRNKDGQNPSCLTMYETSKDKKIETNDLEIALDLIIEDNLEQQLSKIWMDPSQIIDMKPNDLSHKDLMYLSKQLNVDIEETTRLYEEKHIPIHALSKLCAQIVKLDSREFSPKFIKIMAKHVLFNHDIISQCSDKILLSQGDKEILTPQELLEATNPDLDDPNESDQDKMIKLMQSCRIPLDDAKKYTQALIDQGYDDIKSIKEDLDASLLETIMKPGHQKRLLKYLKDPQSIPDLASLLIPVVPRLDSPQIPKEYPLDQQGLKLKRERESYLKPPQDVELRDEIDATSLYSNNTVYYIREIGRGSSGIVYKSFVRPTMNLVAVKHVVIPTVEKQKQIFNELKTLWNISNQSKKKIVMTGKFSDLWSFNVSPFFVPFYNAYVDLNNSGICMVFENMAGGSLQYQIDKKLEPDCDDVAAVAWSMLNALVELHKRHIIHRDIKPGNILITHCGSIKCADFGVVKELQDTSTANTFTGTLLYMSPERILGKPYTQAADIWSLGLTLMVYATNMCPYPINGYWVLSEAIRNGPSLHALRDFPEDFKDFVQRCVAIEEEDRSTAETLLKHPFIMKFLNKCISIAVDPSILRHFSLYQDCVERQADLGVVIDSIVKLETAVYLEKMWTPDTVPEDLDQFELLSKTQLVWLASQLLLDIEYVRSIYVKKVDDFRKFLKSSTMMHLQNVGKLITKGEIPQSNISDKAADTRKAGAEVLESIAVPLIKKQLELFSDEETINVALKPKEPFQFLRSATQAPHKFCSLKRVPSNPDFSNLKRVIDSEPSTSSFLSAPQITVPLPIVSLARPELFVELSKLGVRTNDSKPPLSLWSDRMEIGTRLRQRPISTDKNLAKVNWTVAKVQDVEPETVSKISLLDLSPSESPIMVRQSFNDLNDPIISRDKYKDNEGQYSSLSDGYESENDIIEYDGLYF